MQTHHQTKNSIQLIKATVSSNSTVDQGYIVKQKKSAFGQKSKQKKFTKLKKLASPLKSNATVSRFPVPSRRRIIVGDKKERFHKVTGINIDSKYPFISQFLTCFRDLEAREETQDRFCREKQECFDCLQRILSQQIWKF